LLLANQFSHSLSWENIVVDYGNSVWGVGNDVLAPTSRPAMIFQRSVTTLGVITTLLILAALFSPVLNRDTPSENERRLTRALLLEFATNSVSFFNLMINKKIWLNQQPSGHTSAASYVIRSGWAVFLGEPLTNRLDKLQDIIQTILQDFQRRGLRCLFYQVDQEILPIFHQLGLKSLKIGEEAVLPLASFSLVGSEQAEIRHCVTRLERLKARYEWLRMDQLSFPEFSEIRHLWQEWEKTKGSFSLGFSMNFFPFPQEELGWILLVRGTSPINSSSSKAEQSVLRALTGDESQPLWAVLSFLPGRKGGMVLDLMLRSEVAPNSTMEAAIAEAARFFQTKSLQELSLGLAPLSDVEISKQNNVMKQGVKLVFERMNYFYGYRSLFKFKNKFHPVWRHKYLIYPAISDLPAAILAVVAAHVQNKQA
jgi:phosphatidylglycerol lysyltransferase